MDFNPDLMQQLLEQDLSVPFGEVGDYRAQALKTSLLKKYCPPGSEMALQKAAFEKFLGINNSIKGVDEAFAGSELFHLWKGLIQKALLSGDLTGPAVTLSGCIRKGAQGPGVTNGNDDTLFFTKMFNSHLTTTSEFLYKFYKDNLSKRWLLAETERLQHHSIKIVPGSVLGSVRKDRDEDRTTCKEPTLNMFYQLGAKAQFEDVLKQQCLIDLANQSFKNQHLAKQGSLYGTYATIDLKSASDSISIDLCRKLLPPSVFRVLMQIRSSRSHVGKELIDLNMISTMGNGFTFALMTLIFACLVKAVYITKGLEARFGTSSDQVKTFTTIHRGEVQEINLTEAKLQHINCAVFGDDIIVLTDCVDDVISALSLSGFTLNMKKSFIDGPFRESCGGDYFKGYPVRGVYIKRMNNESAVYSAFNRLHLWSIRSGIPLKRSLLYLLGLASFRPVPLSCGIDQGIQVSLEFSTERKCTRDGGFWYSHLKSVPMQIQCNERFLYHNAGLITFLGGYITDNIMNQRVNNPRYIVGRSYIPYWDYSPHADLTSQDVSDSWASLID